jgi:RNA polymerase sigma factor (sigma-70 family)
MELPPFQTLLDSHGHDVHRFLVANVGAGDADDCYQETWIAALRAYPHLRHATNLRGWLLTIASRKAIDLHRSRGRAPIPVAELPEVEVEVDFADAAGGATGATGAGDVWDAVQILPAKQRSAVVMRYLLDAEYPTIAAAMGTSEPAARRNVYEGLKRLREEHGDEWIA